MLRLSRRTKFNFDIQVNLTWATPTTPRPGHPHCLYALSLQTQNGPTSIRIIFGFCKFYFDSDGTEIPPSFDSILELVNYFITHQGQGNHCPCQNNHSKKRATNTICLRKPLLKKVPTLAHLARLTIHRSLKSQTKMQDLPLPNPIIKYLSEYPHPI